MTETMTNNSQGISCPHRMAINSFILCFVPRGNQCGGVCSCLHITLSLSLNEITEIFRTVARIAGLMRLNTNRLVKKKNAK